MFNGMLGSNKSPNHNRYIRLIVLSTAQICISMPVAFFILAINASYLTVFPWISWDVTHAHYYVVGQVPSFMWRADPIVETSLELERWIIVISAFLFFAFFGFAEEARSHYRKAYSFASSSLNLPVFRKSRGSSSSPHTPSSSYGQGFKKGLATISSFKGGFSSLGSRSNSETTAERKDSLVSEFRLTSSSSILEGVENPPKALEIQPGDDDSQFVPVPTSRSANEVLAAVPNVPLPPPPIARVSVHSLPPGLYPAFPHSPTSSDLYPDPSEKV
jgi:pheromone A receptor